MALAAACRTWAAWVAAWAAVQTPAAQAVAAPPLRRWTKQLQQHSSSRWASTSHCHIDRVAPCWPHAAGPCSTAGSPQPLVACTPCAIGERVFAGHCNAGWLGGRPAVWYMPQPKTLAMQLNAAAWYRQAVTGKHCKKHLLPLRVCMSVFSVCNGCCR
jgi:hypothetical protein